MAPLALFCHDFWSFLHPSYEQAEISAPKSQMSKDPILPLWPFQTSAPCVPSLKPHWYNLCKQFQPIKLFPGELSSPRKVDNVLFSVKHSLAFCMQAIEWAGKSRRMCIEKTQCSPLAMWEDWHIIMFRNNNCTSSTSTTYLINV